jgi:superfamily II DNA/RNA helicase
MIDSYLVNQRNTNNIGRLNAITKFRLASSSPFAFFESFNVKPKVNIVDTKANELLKLLGSAPDERWIVFCEFVQTANYLARIVQDRPVYLMTGESNTEERESVTRKFRDNDNSVLILTSVGSEGLDFQVSSKLVNYDLHWNPMVLEQRIGRIDRVGQVKEEINIYNFIVDGSIDSAIISTLGKKLALIANTFADPGMIIKKNNTLDNSIATGRLLLSDERMFQQEKMFADRLISSELLARNLPTLDYELARALPNELCNIEEWPMNPSEWENGFPLLPKGPSVALWTAQLSNSVDDLTSLLNYYK